MSKREKELSFNTKPETRNLKQINIEKATMEKGVIELTDENFEEKVKKSRGFIVVDFFANWCSPCQILEPILDELASEFSKKIKFGKVNIGKNQKLTAEFHILSMPTLLIFKDGKVIKQLTNGTNKISIKENIEKVLE